MTLETPTETRQTIPATMQLPAPTAWPIVLAFGLSLIFAGLVTSLPVSILGAVLALAGTVGWFRDVLPHEAHETVPVSDRVEPIVTTRPEVASVGWITHELNRSWLPLEIYPVSAGIKGGLAGCIAMAFLAISYGIVSNHGIWYPINLLAAGFFPARNTTAQIAAFHWDSFVVAGAVHLVTSLIVGLLYGATLPMFPRRPILLGGFVAPIMWSALIYSILGMVDPLLNQRIDWPWFVLSQIGFGVVAGIVVSRQVRVRTWQHLPFAARAGVEATGVMREQSREDRRQ
jgi:hypothetical protein